MYSRKEPLPLRPSMLFLRYCPENVQAEGLGLELRDLYTSVRILACGLCLHWRKPSCLDDRFAVLFIGLNLPSFQCAVHVQACQDIVLDSVAYVHVVKSKRPSFARTVLTTRLKN